MNIRLVVLVALLSVSSAVSAKKAPLPMPLAQNLPVEVVLSQQEIAVDVPATAGQIGAQFGLIGALVGASINAAQVSNAERRVAEIRNLLVDYRFNERFEQRLREKLPSEGISPNPQFTILASPWDAETADKANKLEALGVLVVAPRYSIQNNFELMTVSLSISSIDRTFKKNGKPKQRLKFSNYYAFQFPLTKLAGSGATEDSQRWLSLGKERMHAFLDEGIDQVIDMAVYEFSAAGREQAAIKTKAKNNYLHNKAYWGWQVRADPNWIWLREYGVIGMRGYHPVDESAPASVAAAPTPAAAATTEASATPTTTAADATPAAATSAATTTAPAVATPDAESLK
jgi:hypothetical protein